MKERTWRTAIGIRSLGSFQGKRLTSDFGASITDSMATTYGCGGESSGPLAIDRPWDAYSDDQLGLMDHLGIMEFMVMGFCIGGPFIWNL